MQEHDPSAIEPDDVAEPSEPQEADLPKEETDVTPGPRPAVSQQEPEQDSALQTPQPDQPHPPVESGDVQQDNN